MTDSEKAWPPAWTLKPVDGDPYDPDCGDGRHGIGWDLSLGFRLNVGRADADDKSTLAISAHFSDADRARGFVKREATPAQLREFARLLTNLAADHEERARGNATKGKR